MPPAGALSDRLDRRRIVVTVDLLRSVVLVLLALAIATDVASIALVLLASSAHSGELSAVVQKASVDVYAEPRFDASKVTLPSMPPKSSGRSKMHW